MGGHVQQLHGVGGQGPVDLPLLRPGINVNTIASVIPEIKFFFYLQSRFS